VNPNTARFDRFVAGKINSDCCSFHSETICSAYQIPGDLCGERCFFASLWDIKTHHREHRVSQGKQKLYFGPHAGCALYLSCSRPLFTRDSVIQVLGLTEYRICTIPLGQDRLLSNCRRCSPSPQENSRMPLPRTIGITEMVRSLIRPAAKN